MFAFYRCIITLLCSLFLKVVRVVPETVRTCLQTLGGAAEYLLGEFRTVEEKQADFGPMQNYDEGIVSGYAGGGDYGTDQFLETRGAGEGEIIPNMSADVAPAVIGGRVSTLADENNFKFRRARACLWRVRDCGAGFTSSRLLPAAIPFYPFSDLTRHAHIFAVARPSAGFYGVLFVRLSFASSPN